MALTKKLSRHKLFRMATSVVSDRYILKMNTDLNKADLARKLRSFEPWGHRIDFNNGVSTKDFKHRIPFSEKTLQKFSMVEPYLPLDELRSGRLLDVGCNAGYNCIYAAQKYSMKPVGIDVIPRHIESSTFLSDIGGVNAEFIMDNAETFSRPDAFDLVLHFGTLYHLKNPLLALETAWNNLKPGGYMALETQIYEHPRDRNICYFMHMQNHDKTNFWALSPSVLETVLQLISFTEVKIITKTKPMGLEKYMARLVLVARKPDPQ